MNATWEQLHELRAAGKRPTYRVVVTTDPSFAHRVADPAVMCIVHKPGAAMPVELLEGLDVLLWLDNCDQCTAVLRLCRAKEIQPRDLRLWCSCFRHFDTGCSPCKDATETLSWIASLPAEVTA